MSDAWCAKHMNDANRGNRGFSELESPLACPNLNRQPNLQYGVRPMRHLRPMLALVAISAIAVACSTPASSSPGASSGGGGGASAGASTGGGASAAPSTGGGGGGGGTGGINTTLSDGAWTSGTVHVDYSGTKSGSFDSALFGASSLTTGGQTVLAYIDVNAGRSATFAIYSDSFAASVTNSDFAGGGGTTTNCQVSYQKADDHSIQATFDCPNSPVILVTGGNGTVELKGTLSASR